MSMEIHDVAIIGAGLSGLSAANCLRELGLKIVVLEKSRGVGGRAATRRLRMDPGFEVSVDHGAQFFTARDHRFQEQVARWLAQGICFPWCDGFYFWGEGCLHPPDFQFRETRYACRGGMSQMGKSMGEGVRIVREYLVCSVRHENNFWHLESTQESALAPIIARSLIVSAPLPQAISLVGQYLSKEELNIVNAVECSPCIAVMATYPKTTPHPPWRGIQVRDPSSKNSWIGWDSSRREAETQGRIAVLHGTNEFSKQWMESSPDELRMAGLELLRDSALIAGDWMGEPLSYAVHRWRFAHLEGPSAEGGFLRSSSADSLYLIGDGLNGGRIEGAWLSGVFAAEDVMSRCK